MKKFCLTTAIAVFLLFCLNGVQAQTTQTKLNQIELMKQYVGTWQRDVGKDTIDVAEVQQYGKSFVENDYRIIKNEKSFKSIWSIGFSSKEDKFKIFALMPSGNYSTWIASFTTEKKWYLNQVQNFDSDKVLFKCEIVFESPTNLTVNLLNLDGVKTGEEKWIKVK